MNPEELLDLVRLHWDDIRSALDDADREELVSRLGALAATPQQAEREVRRAVQGVRLALLDFLPPGHPLRTALDGLRLAGPATACPRVVEQARELHTWLTRSGGPAPAPPVDPEGIIAAVQRRLLAQPSFSAREVHDGCASTDGLIALDDPVDGTRYPAFQFAGHGGAPIPVVRRVNRLLLADQDPWGAADWWLSSNEWLGGRPATLLGALPEDLLVGAASAMLEGD
ncbi:hypothetical protein PUR34_32600 [Streptomyces sp. JV185]|uniref:hypothetical protein n=1 Tax=Streptomyces sp. JV185 TaxID=858638 RepID=UPI002E77BE95|nr:hypothetical protein [Streptomyces sp. JV185]MEE1772770.1 hypothetical protein [Streptomyces sp. JV185]